MNYQPSSHDFVVENPDAKTFFVNREVFVSDDVFERGAKSRGELAVSDQDHSNHQSTIVSHAAAAESAGVDSFRTKLGVYVLVAAVTAMTGALIYLQKARISPDAAFFGRGA